MSLNLTCEQFEPYQTPTKATFEILAYFQTESGEWESKGGWVGVRDRYLEWLRSVNQSAPEFLEEHTKLVMSFDYLEFSYI